MYGFLFRMTHEKNVKKYCAVCMNSNNLRSMNEVQRYFQLEFAF